MKFSNIIAWFKQQVLMVMATKWFPIVKIVYSKHIMYTFLLKNQTLFLKVLSIHLIMSMSAMVASLKKIIMKFWQIASFKQFNDFYKSQFFH